MWFMHSPPQREVRTGTQGSYLESGTEADAMEECCSLACSPWLAQPSSDTHDQLPRVATTPIYWTLPHQIIN